ncbi:hypothetical protein [Streptomyces sp. NPDC059708]|uniref:hypothetical protein n=1 Tax=Streptomyces sp. NPDC059708 TaxID=3346916 RepID=UPI0036C44E15
MSLPVPPQGTLPSYYNVAPLSVTETAQFTGRGWEVGFYRLNKTNTYERNFNEPIDDLARDADGVTVANQGTERNYHGFRYVLQKVVNASAIKLDSKLDQPSTATVSVPLGGEPVGILRGEVTPYHSAIEVSYDGYTMFGGIVWTCRADFFKQVLTISASDFLSFYAHRVSDHSRITGELALKAPMEQVAALWCCTAKVSNYNSGIHSAIHYTPPARPIKRDVDLGYGQFNKVLDSLYRWADSTDGFFVYEQPVRQGPARINSVEYKATTLNSNIHFTATRKPSLLTIDGKPVELVDRQNCEVTDLFVDGSTYANYSYAVGIPYRASKWVPRAEADATKSLDVISKPEPIKDVAVKHNIRTDEVDEKNQGSADAHNKANWRLLQEKADQQLKWGSSPSILPTVRVYPDLFHPGWFKQANEGHTVLLSSRNEYAQLDRDEYVIMGTSIDVDKDGSSVIDLDLVQRAKFPT